MKITSERIAKLPKWAQEYIADLRTARADDEMLSAMEKTRRAITRIEGKLDRQRSRETTLVRMPSKHIGQYITQWSDDQSQIVATRPIQTLLDTGWRIMCIVSVELFFNPGKSNQSPGFYRVYLEREG